MSDQDRDMIWASLPVAAVLIDSDDQITAVNPMAEVFLNTSEAAMQGRAFSARINIEGDLTPGFSRAREGQAALMFNHVNVSGSDRAAVPCNIQIAPLSDGSGGLMVLFQARRIAGQLGRALQISQATQTAIGLSDMLAHEIKNPLAGITGAAQLLAMGLKGDDLEMTDLIVQETRRILGLLEQVEQFGDLRPPEFKPLNIHDLLEQAKTSASVGYAAHMKFSDNYDPSLPLISGDGDQLLQVFGNLFKNASEAAGDRGGTISIKTYFEMGLRLRRDDGRDSAVPLHLEISDDGPGITPEVAERLFEPFVSGRENGTGLGLALVSKIVTQHHGSVAVFRKNGRTVFKISLPLAPKTQG